MSEDTKIPTHQTGPLSGLVILELGHFIAAPFATRVLADLGAEVIKVEPPGRGDPDLGQEPGSEQRLLLVVGPRPQQALDHG
jgi:crotonobetainyl-CoA:carnitine CoA-transferase CaiB-like acyl-CoA transferase